MVPGHSLLPFHRERPGPVTKNESKEFVSIEGPAGTRSVSTPTSEKANKGESAIISILNLRVPKILERIKEVLGKVPGGTTPNVFNYSSEHSLTIKNMPR